MDLLTKIISSKNKYLYIWAGISLFATVALGVKFVQIGGVIDMAVKSLILLTFIILMYFSAYDFKKMSIPNIASLLVVILFIGINIFLLKTNRHILITDTVTFDPYQNLLASMILSFPALILVVVSKEELLGFGDVRMFLLMGLLIGSKLLVVGLLLTIFLALGYGLYIALQRKSLKGIRVPFVPFIASGAIFSMFIYCFLI